MQFTITNRKGKKFIVLYDKRDRKLIKSREWYVSYGYVLSVKVHPERLHRLILNLKDRSIHVDHANHNKLDNRRKNLRKCTRSQNMANRKAGGVSKYLGVSYRVSKKGVGQYTYSYIIATICKNHKRHFLGNFQSEKEAARAYDKAAKKLHGKFANLNFK